MNSRKFQKDFLNQLNSTEQLELLFEYLPDVYFFAKNTESQFVMANSIFVKKCGVSSESDIIGKTDRDFFPLDRAENYISDDREVISTGKSIVNKVELAPEADNAINWFVTSKVPLYSREGRIVGIAGSSRDINKASLTLKPYADMSAAIDYINKNYNAPMEISDLAAVVNLSVSQFERKFKNIFQLTPLRHITNIRIKAACHLLATTNKTIASIAQETGFYDHSHLTRQFTQQIGMTPKLYRKQNSR